MSKINLNSNKPMQQPPKKIVTTIENDRKTEQIFENGRLKQVNVSIDRNGDGKFDSNELFYVDHYKEENGGTRVSRSIDNDFDGVADKFSVFKFDGSGKLTEQGDTKPYVFHEIMMNQVKEGKDGTSWYFLSEYPKLPNL